MDPHKDVPRSSLGRKGKGSTILVDNVPSNANDKIDRVNDNDNNGSITWDDVMAMEDAARELEEVPVPASPPVIDPSMARTARFFPYSLYLLTSCVGPVCVLL